MTVQVHILLGGVASAIDLFGIELPYGWDGVIDSRGMNGLADQLKAVPAVKSVTSYDWGDWDHAIAPIVANKGIDKIAVIGYSGGGSRATCLADTLFYKKPMVFIDLMVLYDPSPAWQMYPTGENVRNAICYYNTNPMMFGLGGGKLTGTGTIDIYKISEQHLEVQSDQSLHQRTVAAVKGLL